MIYSYEKVFDSLLKLLLLIWGILCLVVFASTAYFFTSNFSIIIPITLLGGLVGIFSSSYIYVVFSLPYMLLKDFDKIKNKLALHTYKTVSEFQEDISDFLLRFYRFPGLSLLGGEFHFKNANLIKKNTPSLEIENLNRKSKKFTIHKLKHGQQAIYIPIEIEGVYLGYMLLYTEKYSLPFFADILNNFENQNLDDQLLHLMYQLKHM